MRYKVYTGILWIVSVFVCTAPALAHHAFSSEYDGTKNVTLTGTLTKVVWVNPHVFLHVDVKDRNGKVTNWAIEMGPTVALHRY